MMSRRFDSTLQKNNARVDGGSTQGCTNGDGRRKIAKSGDGVPFFDNSGKRVAPDDTEAVQYAIYSGQFCEVIRHRCGLVGVRVREPTQVPELFDCLQQDLMSGMRKRRIRGRVLGSESVDFVDVAELSAGEQSVPRETRGRKLVLVSSTQMDFMVSTVPDSTHAVAGADEDVEPVGESDTERNRSVSVAGGDADVTDEGPEVEPYNSLIR